MLKLDVKLEQSDFPNLSEGQISKMVRSVTSRVRDAVVANTPIGDRPLKGRKRTKASWTAIKKDEGGYSFGNPLVQAKFLESGSEIGSRPWPHARSRTVYNEGRVYSSQAPEGIFKKANVDRLTKDIAFELFELIVQGKSIAKR